MGSAGVVAVRRTDRPRFSLMYSARAYCMSMLEICAFVVTEVFSLSGFRTLIEYQSQISVQISISVHVLSFEYLIYVFHVSLVHVCTL